MKPMRLAVRKMVELVLRCGDIDSRFADASAMVEGAKAHRKLQKQMGANYQSEVSLSLETEMGGIPVKLFGRADGVIIEDDGRVTIDEIKSTTLTLEQIYEQRAVHLGQAKCYAVMLLAQTDSPPPEVTIQLTYYQLETEEIRRHLFVFTNQDLLDFFEETTQKYGVWLRFERDWRITRDASIKETVFPFASYRKGQRELAVAAYRTIEKQKKLYVQAPTGIGKTLSTLFPSIKAIGEGHAEKIFYLTAKTVTRAVAEDAVRLMLAKNLRLKSLTLRAKEKICSKEEQICNPDYCEFAKGHFDRINDALLDMLENNDLITPEVVTKYSQKHRVCPYEAINDAAKLCDVVVCDYNHVFDPTVFLRSFFTDVDEDYIFLIDEAHNLADRVRDMYTSALKKSQFSKLKGELKVTGRDKNAEAKNLRKKMIDVINWLKERQDLCGEQRSFVSKEVDEELVRAVALFAAATEEWLQRERHNAHPLEKDILELFFSALEFLLIAELYDEHYTSITEVFGGEIVYTLFCLDPSNIIAERLKLAKASVLFSATLTPLRYYREILGGSDDDGILALPSPFDKEKLLLMAHQGISTKYKDRESSIVPIVESIFFAVSQKKGNYIAYFPSYEYLKQVYDAFVTEYPEIKTTLQQSKMDEQAREDFLSGFDANNSETLLGFCVLGGVFSEGIDLAGDRLIGTIIVGVGLPKISLRQDLIREYFEEKSGDGYDYAYVYPGMNKVLQAAGRVIRSESDFGEVLLIESRFATAKYRELYPEHWSNMNFLRSSDNILQQIKGFLYFKKSTNI